MREYDSLEQESALFDELLRARKEAGLTQAEVAERMATQPSVVARLEAGGGRLRHSPVDPLNAHNDFGVVDKLIG